MGSPLQGAVLGPRVPQRSRHTGTQQGLGRTGKSHGELPPEPHLRRQPICTTMAHGPPRNSTETRQPHTKPREGDHARTGRNPAAGPHQQGTHPLFQANALAVQPPPVPPRRARSKKGTPAPIAEQAKVDAKATTSHPHLNPASAPPDPPTLPGQASLSSSLPSQAPLHPEAYTEFQKGTRVQQPFRNDDKGDRIWWQGRIQYRLQGKGQNSGVQIRLTWHRPPELNQSSAPDEPEGNTLELNSAQPIRRATANNKDHRGIKYTEEIPPEWSQGLPPRRPPKRPPPGKKSSSSSPPPWGGKGRGLIPLKPRLAATEAAINLLDLNHPAIT